VECDEEGVGISYLRTTFHAARKRPTPNPIFCVMSCGRW
jgi:hypothetical protein